MCWGSFLNVLGYRLVHNHNFTHRSRCTHCKSIIAWYDNIPILSWFLLGGKCRNCRQTISWLYPFIEAVTTLMLSLLYITIPAQYFFAYFIFFSALIVTIRSDLETMLISRFATIFLLPLGIVLSIFGLLPISPIESIASALGGYFFLYIIGKIFYFIKRKNGIGQGDLDLLAFIGAFTGILGLWVTVLFGSIAGSLIGLLYLVITNKPGNSTHIPFGPFLAFAAMAFVLFYYARIHHAF